METTARQETPVITTYQHAGPVLRRSLWEMYTTTFTEINTLAVQNHMMPYEEFVEVMLDRRVVKYVATDESGAVLGMSLLTNDLSAWPLVSAPYFERHWPVHYAARSVWYVGFVAVATGAPFGLFPALIARMYEPVKASHGVAVMDFCSYNVATRRLPAATQAILRRLNPTARGAQIDAQEFWLWEFPEV
jgi:hypothetical protein